MIKLVLIGCGAVADILYRPAFQRLSRRGIGQLAAVVDTDLSRARKYAAAFKAGAFRTLEEAVASVKLDAAVVATPHAWHRTAL